LLMVGGDCVEDAYRREIRYSTAEFPMGFIDNLPGFVGDALQPVAYGAMQQALKMKVDFETELRWEKPEYDGSKILQVRAMPHVPDQLKHLDEMTMELAVPIKMQEGDMLLLDNYLVMHGRCPFEVREGQKGCERVHLGGDTCNQRRHLGRGWRGQLFPKSH